MCCLRWKLRTQGRLDYFFPDSFRRREVGNCSGFTINEFARAKIDASVNELDEERLVVSDLAPG